MMIILTSLGPTFLTIVLAAALLGFVLRFRTPKDAGQYVKFAGGYGFFGVAALFLFILFTYGVHW
jgi:hypothetical protein